MDFDREDVLPLTQYAGWQQGCEGGCAVILGRARSERTIGDRAGRHVVPANFSSIQIKNRPVVALQVYERENETANISGGERLAIIGSDKFVCRIRAKGIRGSRLLPVGIAVTSRGRAAGLQHVL